MARPIALGADAQRPVLQHERFVGRDDVDAVGFERDVLHNLDHRHGRHAAEDLGEMALGVRAEMLDDHIGRARSVRRRLEEGLQGPDAAGGRSEADHRDGGPASVICAIRHDDLPAGETRAIRPTPGSER